MAEATTTTKKMKSKNIKNELNELIQFQQLHCNYYQNTIEIYFPNRMIYLSFFLPPDILHRNKYLYKKYATL